jgi:hypothetical protein
MLLGAAAGWIACRLVSSVSFRRPRLSLDYSVAGRAGVYDPYEDERDSYNGAPDADESQMRRMLARVHAVGECGDRLMLKARAGIARIAGHRAG